MRYVFFAILFFFMTACSHLGQQAGYESFEREIVDARSLSESLRRKGASVALVTRMVNAPDMTSQYLLLDAVNVSGIFSSESPVFRETTAFASKLGIPVKFRLYASRSFLAQNSDSIRKYLSAFPNIFFEISILEADVPLIIVAPLRSII